MVAASWATTDTGIWATLYDDTATLPRDEPAGVQAEVLRARGWLAEGVSQLLPWSERLGISADGGQPAAAHRDAWFIGAHFDGGAWFTRPNSARGAWVMGPNLGGARFTRAHFGGDAWFTSAHFDAGTAFDEAHFGGDAAFDGAYFGGDAAFNQTGFGGFTAHDATANGQRTVELPRGWKLAAPGQPRAS